MSVFFTGPAFSRLHNVLLSQSESSTTTQFHCVCVCTDTHSAQDEEKEEEEEVPEGGECGVFLCGSGLSSSYNTGSSSIGSSVDLLVSVLSGTEPGCSTSTLREAMALTVSASSSDWP